MTPTRIQGAIPRLLKVWRRQSAIVLALLSLLAFLPAPVCHGQEQTTVEWVLTLRDLEARAGSSNLTDADRTRLMEAGRYNLGEAGAVLLLDQFTIVDMQASYRFSENMEMQGGINNIFDRNYSLFEGYPEAGCNLFVNVRYRF